MYPDVKKWQARRESNPQPAVLETAALPIELLACIVMRASKRLRNSGRHNSGETSA